MLTPERFHELVLDYAYDLLEEVEAASVREYLQAHPEAQAHLDRVRGLLAGAARYEFPGMRFAAPSAAPAPLASPAVATPSADSGRTTMRGVWVRWLVAAGVLLAIGALGYPVARHLVNFQAARNSYEVARHDVSDVQEARQRLVRERGEQMEVAGRKVADAEKAIETLSTDHQVKLNKAEAESRAKQLVLEVTGPPAIQPGAPNHFEIATRSKTSNNIVTARLNVRVTDDRNNVLFEDKDILSQGMYTLHLPADLPYKPNTRLALDVTASSEGQVRSVLNERLEWAAPRYITHLATDRPMYQPGQTVFFRSLTLNRANLHPPEEDFHVVFTITNPSGAEVYHLDGETRLQRLTAGQKPQAVLGPDGKPVRGLGAGEFAIPDYFDGGEYVLSVREAGNRFPEEKRKFIINKYKPDRLNKKLDFHRTTYGPGDEVIANCTVSSAERNGAVENIRFVGATAMIDNALISGAPLGPIDALGRIRVRFVLPRQIDRGKASVSVTFADNGVNETIQKPLPIVINRMFVEFFPEGGDLVAGVTNRVYFQAKNNLDKPADLEGRLLDSHGAEVAAVATFNDDTVPGANQGLGVFSFVPKAGERYELKIDKPKGIEKTIALLSEKVRLNNDGVALSVPTGVTAGSEPIRVELQAASKSRRVLVGAYSRGRLLDHQRVAVEPGRPTVVELKPAENPGGVVRVTAFEEKDDAGQRTLVPRAERLVYRKSDRAIRYTIEPSKPRYSPGDSVSLKITSVDEAGKPAAGVALVSVVNQTVVTMADEKTARSLGTFFALDGEVRKAEDLEYADFLLSDHPKAPTALDLLLGVQGWRRFAEQNPAQFMQRNAGDAAKFQDAVRLAVLSGQNGQRVDNNLVTAQNELERQFQPRLKDLSDQLLVAMEEQQAVAGRDAEYRKQLAEQDADFGRKRAAYESALADLRAYDDRHQEMRRLFVPILGGASILLAVGLVAIGALRGSRRGVPYHAAAAVSLAGGVLLLVGSMLVEIPGERGSTVVAQLDTPAPVPAAPAPAIHALDAPNDVLEGLDRGRALAGPQGGGNMTPPRAAPGFAVPAAPAKPEKEMLKMEEDKNAKGPANRPGGPVAAGVGGGVPPARFRMDMDPAVDAKKAGARLFQNFQDKYDKGQAGGKMAPGPMVPELKQRGGEALREQLARDDDQVRRRVRDLVEQGRNKDMARGAGPSGVGAGRASKRPNGFPGGGFGGAGGMAGPAAGFGPGQFGPAGFDRRGQAMGAPGDAPAPPAPRPEPFFVREYAFSHESGGNGLRNDFAETVFWTPVAVFDEAGKATVSFQLSDSVTRYRILVAGHTLEGRLGEATQLIEARKPFSVDAKLPVEMTASDRLDLPIVIVNDSDAKRSATVAVEPKNMKAVVGPSTADSVTEKLALNANERSRRLVSLRPSIVEGEARLTIRGTTEASGSDSVERTIPIVPDGFPAAGGKSDLFASDLLEKIARYDLELPKDYVPGTLKLQAHIYPSTLADLQKGLDALLREPNGCFEQTSTTNYPNTLILNYIRESGEKNPAAVQRAEELLGRGYQRLTSFECQKPAGGREGYEWFGGMAPPHEALTAYGLLQFKDMARVHPVDAEMLERTRKYLLSRRKPEGGFARNERALDTFGRAPQHITDAYILWALTETGKEDFSKDIDKLLKDHADSKDPYFLSLLANALLNSEGADKTQRAVDLLKRVRDRQAADGGLDGAETSITCSGGRDLRIETTALGVLGWLKANRPAEFTEPLNKAIRWISQQRGGYGAFGSTQSTILALKALIGYTVANKKTPEGGELTLYAGEQKLGSTRFLSGRTEAVTVDVENPEKFVHAGTNPLRLELSTKGSFPYTIAWSYSMRTPASSAKCQVRLATSLSQDRVLEGQGVRLNATLENVAGKGLPMTVAIIGLPAGLKVPEDMKQLKDMARLRKTGPNGELEAGEISYFELRGRELVLYWRDVKPQSKIELAIDLIAEVPGEFHGPASRAYLYYNADDKHWVEPLSIAITPRPAE